MCDATRVVVGKCASVWHKLDLQTSNTRNIVSGVLRDGIVCVCRRAGRSMSYRRTLYSAYVIIPRAYRCFMILAYYV